MAIFCHSIFTFIEDNTYRHTHTQGILNIKSWAASQHTEQGLEKNYSCSLSSSGRQQHTPCPLLTAQHWVGRAQHEAASAHQGTNTHTEHLWAPAGEHQNVSTLLHTRICSPAGYQLDGVKHAQSSSLGSLQCIILPSQPGYLVRSQCLIDVLLPKD